MKRFFLIVIIGFISKSHSQTDLSNIYINDSIIKKGVSLYDSNKFEEAITEYDKISTNDPKYLSAQYEKALCLNALEKKDELRSFLEKLYINKQMQKNPELYTLYAVFLSDNNEFELSEKIFTEAEQYLSNSSNFLYNFAILYVRKQENQKAIDLLKRIITINPNHASAHYLMGLMAFENGKITEGTLALMSYLMIAPTGKFAEKAIIQLNTKYGENYLTKSPLIFSKTGDNFEEIETILRNQLPLNKAYKIKSEIDDVIIRQTQAIAEYTLEHKMGDGFFETTYIPWVKDMVQKNYFEGFSYYMLLSLENNLGKVLTKQKKKITDFQENYYDKDFWSSFAKRKMDLFGKQEDVIVFLKDGNPYLIGKVIDGKYEGKFKLLNKNGNLVGELNFSNDQLDGLQKYYNDEGTITEEKTFKNGKLDGTSTTYHANGVVSFIENYKDGILEGISSSFYPNGSKHCEVNFTHGERNGNYQCLFENGNKKLDINYVNGKLNGPYKIYNELGALTENKNYDNDLIDGEYTEYYDDKTIKSQTVYKQGKIEGLYKVYYANSLLKTEIDYTNGQIKQVTDYYPGGKKSNLGIYNDKGELENYRYFDSNEILYFEEFYKSGEIKSGIQYSNDNHQPVETNFAKTKFQIKDYNGALLAAGNFIKGKKDNNWQYNYSSGALRTEENYIDGQLNGIFKTFYKNGSLNNIANYSNNKMNGRSEVYDNGKLISFYNYVDNQKNGPYQNFYPDGSINNEGYYIDENLNYDSNFYWQNGKICKHYKYINGTITKKITYNENGEIENEIDYKNKTGKFNYSFYNGTVNHIIELVNGTFNGPFIEKDKLGNIIVEANYINGLLNSDYKYYSPTGKLFVETSYYLGNRNGKTKIYDLTGNLRTEYSSIFGIENGKTINYYHNKSKLSEYTQLNDSKEGENLYYNQKGELLLTIGYQNNSPVYYIAKNKNGEIPSKTAIKNENATIVSYYPNGQIAIKLNIVNGETDGKFIINNSNGNTEYESNYSNNMLNGERVEYYSNGHIYKKERFVNNNFEGLQEYFAEDSKPITSSEYKNDQLHGTTLIFNSGKLVTTKKYNSNELVEISK